MRIEGGLPNLPRVLNRPVRRTASFLADLLEGVRGQNPLVPPRSRRAAVGSEDLRHFRAVGEEFLRLFREPGGLQPWHRVLDVGCGIGRMAVPLTSYLDPRGSYEGFDVVASDVAWCRKAISRQFAKFRFQHVDVVNSEFNPKGRIEPETFAFPYPDSSFDFVFATSVFTHLLAPAAGRYLSEIARVLAPEGRCLLTAFLLTARFRDGVPRDRPAYGFACSCDGAQVEDLSRPEAAVAFSEEDFERLVCGAALAVTEWRQGYWTGEPGLAFQDVLVCRHRDRE